jgi:hypothetical protein
VTKTPFQAVSATVGSAGLSGTGVGIGGGVGAAGGGGGTEAASVVGCSWISARLSGRQVFASWAPAMNSTSPAFADAITPRVVRRKLLHPPVGATTPTTRWSPACTISWHSPLLAEAVRTSTR